MTKPGGIVTIDTQSEAGSWAETLASPSCQILTQHRQQVGQVTVTFTMGRIPSRSTLLAAGAEAPNVSSVNSPAAGNGGGHSFLINDHEAGNG